MLDEIRAEAVTLGKNPDDMLPKTVDELLSNLREGARLLLGEAE